MELVHFCALFYDMAGTVLWPSSSALSFKVGTVQGLSAWGYGPPHF